MKILLRYRTCEITFSEADPFYAGKIVELHGEAFDDTTFHVPKSERIYWLIPSLENQDSYIGKSVDDSEKERLLSYIVEKAQETSYKFILW